MPGGKRGERPSRQRSPLVTRTITAGSVRGKWSAPQPPAAPDVAGLDEARGLPQTGQ
jgi:hypothetical protein